MSNIKKTTSVVNDNTLPYLKKIFVRVTPNSQGVVTNGFSCTQPITITALEEGVYLSTTSTIGTNKSIIRTTSGGYFYTNKTSGTVLVSVEDFHYLVSKNSGGEYSDTINGEYSVANFYKIFDERKILNITIEDVTIGKGKCTLKNICDVCNNSEVKFLNFGRDSNITGDISQLVGFTNISKFHAQYGQYTGDVSAFLSSMAQIRTSGKLLMSPPPTASNCPKGLDAGKYNTTNYVHFTTDKATYPNGWYVGDADGNPLL